MRPTTNPKHPEVVYRKRIDKIVQVMRESVRANIYPLLRQFEPEYVNDAYARSLSEAFTRLRESYERIGDIAKTLASEFVGDVNHENKKRFYSAMEDAVGVNLSTIISNEQLDDILVASVSENVSLIRSIPEQYLKNVESIVFTGTTQGNKPGGMEREIEKAGRVTQRRAKLIARDQTSKINSALSQQRQQNLGVEEYIWRTAGDDRVRDTHKANNGKTFRWDKPPKATGHPGTDIQCRCVAQPVIRL